MIDFELITFGDLKEFQNGFGFKTHPIGTGPLDEFTSGVVFPDRIKILLPKGLCFEGTISNHAQLFEDLSLHPAQWQIHFCWETKLPLIRIVIPGIDREFILALTLENDWVAGYAPLDTGYDHLERFELFEWSVPTDLQGKIISVVSPEVFGKEYC